MALVLVTRSGVLKFWFGLDLALSVLAFGKSSVVLVNQKEQDSITNSVAPLGLWSRATLMQLQYYVVRFMTGRQLCQIFSTVSAVSEILVFQ